MKSNSSITTHKRLLIVIISITFLFLLLFIRLCYLQLVVGKEYTVRAENQWYRDLPLKAKRGSILDNNGEIIVDSRDVFTVYARPRAITDRAKTTKILSAMLNISEETMLKKLSNYAVGEVTIKKNIDYDLGVAVREQKLDGVYLTLDSARNYPYGEYLAQVIGYTNADNQGQNGLEGYYDKLIRGVDGVALDFTDNKGVGVNGGESRFIPSIDGANLYTTIDINIQSFAESAVKGAKTEWNSKDASVIVMDVNTGGITAMARALSYDLADLPRNDIAMLNAYSKNTMIVDVYEPGSTFKIFTTASAIEKGKVNDNDRFFCAGYRLVDGQRIKCWRSKGHGSQDLAQGVQNSCNCVFMDLAQRLGTESFYQSLRQFGFGSKTGVDFFAESSGLLMNEKSVKTVDLARIGFGQAVAVTPLQLVAGVSAVVNGGIYHTPHFVNAVVDNDGREIYSFSDATRKVISESTSQKMREMLESVVAEGSGKKASVSGYRIGGKTGTAQKYENGIIAQGKYVSSFIGFAPADNPKYAILLTIDEPNSYAYYGSIVAAPYVGQIFSKIFNYLAIPPTQSQEQVFVDMPYLLGKSINTATKILDELGVKYEVDGDGETVSETYPSFDEKISQNDVILIKT